MNMETKRPKLALIGNDGNAFVILGLAKRAARKAKMPMDQWDKIQQDVMSGDYDHLLQVMMEHFDVC